jgi:hypothetical protein
MFIAKKPDGRLCFTCDECSWTCERPEDLDDFERGYEGFEKRFDVPTLTEIIADGWLEYTTHEEVQDVCEFCGFNLHGAPADTCPSCNRRQSEK